MRSVTRPLHEELASILCLQKEPLNVQLPEALVIVSLVIVSLVIVALVIEALVIVVLVIVFWS